MPVVTSVASGIPQGGPLTANLDADGYAVNNVDKVRGSSGLVVYGDPVTVFDAAKVTLSHTAAAGGGAAVLRGGDATTGATSGGAVSARGGDGSASGIDGGSATLQAGDAGGPSFGGGAKVSASEGLSDGTNGRVIVYTNATVGSAGQALVSDGNFSVVYGGVRVAAAVPVASPAGNLPFAYDTTAVTGGFYFWNGSAWVKIATIL